MAGKLYHVNAVWDEEAGVWVATSDDVPGLVTEAETRDALTAKLHVLIPELLEANGAILNDSLDIPFEVVTTKQEKARRVAH